MPSKYACGGFGMKIYIAGKITGDPDYKAKFAKVENALSKRARVLSPAILPEGFTRADYMRMCFAMIDTANAVAFLPDWQHSLGARLEHQYCEYIGKRIIYLEDGNDGQNS